MEFLLQLIADLFGGEITENQEFTVSETIDSQVEEILEKENEEVVEEPNLFSVFMFR